MARALMIGGVFLLSREPRRLADWYSQYPGWHLAHLEDDDTYYAELYYREDDSGTAREHLVYAIMPGDPGVPGGGHIVNYRVDDLERIVDALTASGVDVSPITVGPDADGEGKFARLLDPEGHRIELWQHLNDG